MRGARSGAPAAGVRTRGALPRPQRPQCPRRARAWGPGPKPNLPIYLFFYRFIDEPPLKGPSGPSKRMGDRGPRRAEARAGRRHRSRWPPHTGAGSDRALGRTLRAYAHTEPDQCIERGALGAIPASRWAARDSRSSGSRPRMRGLYRYTVCKRTNKPKARTAPVQSTPRTFVRGVLRARASATGRPAGSPAFYEHCFVNGPGPSESLDRPGRTFTAKPREKGARPRTHSGACGGALALGRAFVYLLDKRGTLLQ